MCAWQVIEGGVTEPQGFTAAGVSAGIKESGKKDMALIYAGKPCSAAGVFTQNLVKAAPVLLDMEHLKKTKGIAQAIIVNSGNANACTGGQGMQDARAMAQLTAAKLGIEPETVLVSSTGVIGQLLPMEKVEAGVALAAASLSKAGSRDAAEAIMTTDTKPKEIAVKFTLQGKEVTIGAMAKGAGMIHPNMATMLCFITTDAVIEPAALKQALQTAVDATFNMLTVDGDTSTNDTVLILASGLAGHEELTEGSDGYADFVDALTYACGDLARKIAADGEGATKLLEVEVRNAPSLRDARLVAKAVASSNLVKTALFGEDANWGRILCAAGYSGAQFDPYKVDIYLKSRAGQLQTAAQGAGIPFDEEQAALILKEKEITFILDLHGGEAGATAYTCDFSYDYVRINADYRT
ncbi:MAG TPA: bifunctional glutamate N-acetyltransferase/amino-acid acetyltransferase ArgJ [Clostridia bacterium]|nr:bifunctional glutamate N-acetyltransferase/amino-acid acetyltransferase ArgJ [Clostridia bacterium]